MRHRGKSHINFQKIPLLPDVTSWKDVEIQECGERVVSLNELYSDRIIVKPQYFLQEIKDSLKECFVREAVAKMLIKASQSLPSNYEFVIWDAWRPIETQKALFNSYKDKLNASNPTLSEDELGKLIQKYVSLPSLDKTCPPPHSTGGAVDLSIGEQDGNYLDMGTTYDDFSNRASTRYFEEKIEKGENLSSNEMVVINNRRLLFNILTEVGFTNYPDEWWHYDYGNQFWAKAKGVNAIYGRVDLKDLDKGI